MEGPQLRRGCQNSTDYSVDTILKNTTEILTPPTQVVHPTRRSFQPIWLLWGGVGLLLAAKILFSLNIFWQIFNFAFQIDESESMIVAETGLMDHGLNLYALPSPDRFVSAPYTPLYYLLNWPFLHFMGLSFKPGRLLSLLATVGIAVLLYKLVRAYGEPGKGRGPAGVAALAWSSLGVVAFWGSAVKPDMTALLFDLAGLYLIFTRHDEQDWRRLYGGAGLFALAALTKQTAFAGVLVAGGWLLLSGSLGGRERLLRLVKFGAVYGGLAFGPMAAMNLLSGGGFWYHIVTVHELPWSSQNYLKFLGGFLQSYQLFGLVALAFVPLWLLDVRPFGLTALRNNRGTFIVLYLGASAGASLSTGTFGGNHNHLLELAAAGNLALGATLTRLMTWWPTRRRMRWSLVIALILLGWQTLGSFLGEARLKPADFPVLGNIGPAQTVLTALHDQFYNPDWLGLEYRVPPADLKNRLSQIAAFMNNDSSPLIYSDNVSLMLATNRPIFTTDPFTQTHATFYGRWDESKLRAMVRSGAFGMIVLRQPVALSGAAGDIYLSPGLAQAVRDGYRLACHDAAYIYVPKTRTDFKGC